MVLRDGVAKVFEAFVAGDGMQLRIESGFVAKRLFEYLQVAWCEAYDVGHAAGKLLVRRKKMIIKLPDHKLSQTKDPRPGQK